MPDYDGLSDDGLSVQAGWDVVRIYLGRHGAITLSADLARSVARSLFIKAAEVDAAQAQAGAKGTDKNATAV